MKTALTERFLRYVAIPSQSNPAVSEVPSSPGQWDMVRLLESELTALGFVDLHISEHACLTGKLPATPDVAPNTPAVGFCAHVDTVDVNLSPEIHPQIVRNYDGGVITLNREQGIYLDPAEHPELNAYVGDDIICTDGTSVLGADDKAAVTSIMTAMQHIVEQKISHGDIYVAFVPDEEIGLRGAKKLELDRFPVAYAYTLDCCGIGEVVYETFNAGSGFVRIRGISAHPMSAKGVLLNPILVATDLIQLFNRLETPENTDGTDGYIWIHGIQGNQSDAVVELNIRDHNKERYEARKSYIRQAVALIQEKYPRAQIELELEDVYANIKDALRDDNREAIDHIYEAMKRLDITPITLSMRGGTDGSYLSSQGLLTPNFFTGAHNFHSNCEFLPLNSFEKSCQMVLTLIELIREKAQ